jgi:hypothetical protein
LNAAPSRSATDHTGLQAVRHDLAISMTRQADSNRRQFLRL